MSSHREAPEISKDPVADSTDLYAFRYATNDAPNSLYYREARDGIVVVSEPLDRNHESWTTVPENSVVIARSGQPAEVRPFLPPAKLRRVAHG